MALAQDVSDTVWVPQLFQSATIPLPKTIPGLALWWVYTDTTTNNVAPTNWIDRIQSLVWTNGDSASRPTNTVIGMGYGGASPRFLTNQPQFDMGTNWSVVMFVTDANPSSSAGLADGLFCENGSNFNAGLNFQGTTVDRLFWTSHAGGNTSLGAATISRSNEYDIVFMESNSVSSSGATFGFTNGIFYASAARESVDTYLGGSGANLVSGANHLATWFDGYMREFMVFTNLLSSQNISNIHYYRTNTYGGSP